MIDMSSVQAALAGINSAHQLLKSLLESRDARLQAEKGYELRQLLFTQQEKALEIYAELSAAQKEISELKERIARFDQWENEKGRYALHEINPGVLCYRIKPANQGSEPPHDLCANCYQAGIKSILQIETLDVGLVSMKICPKCRAELIVSGYRPSKVRR